MIKRKLRYFGLSYSILKYKILNWITMRILKTKKEIDEANEPAIVKTERIKVSAETISNSRFNRMIAPTNTVNNLAKSNNGNIEVAAAVAPVGGRVPMREQGNTGLDARNGRIYQEYSAELSDLSTRMARYEEMRRSDAALAALEALISLPIRASTWYIEPGDDKKIAEEISDNLFNSMSHSFDSMLRQILLAPLYGFTVHEKVFEYKPSGFLGWHKFAERGRRTIYEWGFDETGGLKSVRQVGFRPNDGSYFDKTIDINKLMVWSWRNEEGNPEGLGAFRQAWKHYFYKTAFEEFAAMRIENQALGIWIATPPDEGAQDGDVDKVIAMISRLRAGESSGIVLPDGWELRNEQQGPADVPFETHIERQHQYMLQSALGHFVGLGQSGDKGSFAQSEDASSMFMLAERACADWVCETFNRYAIPQLVKYNTNNTKKYPKLRHGPIGVRDLDKLGNFLRSIWDVNVDIPADLYPMILEESGLPKLPEKIIKEHLSRKDEVWENSGRNDAKPEEKPVDDKVKSQEVDDDDNND